jgi:hypothetical protein
LLRNAGLVSIVISGAFSARAQPGEPAPVRLSLERSPGAESCPGDAELGRRVAARIGRDPFSEQATRSVEVRIQRAERHWRAEIRLLDAERRAIATREPLDSTAADCSALADAVVLAVALTIDPDAALDAPSTTPPPLPAPPIPCPEVRCPTPRCAPCVAPAPAPEPEPEPVRAGLRAVGALGVLPAPALGVSLAAEVEATSGFSIGVAVLYMPEVKTDDGELAFGLTAFEPFGCARLIETRSAELSGCAGLQLGSLHAVAHGLRPLEPGDYPWLAATLGPRGTLAPTRGLRLELGAVAAAPLIAHDFVVRGRPGSAHEPATIGLFGFIGFGVAAP